MDRHRRQQLPEQRSKCRPRQFRHYRSSRHPSRNEDTVGAAMVRWKRTSVRQELEILDCTIDALRKTVALDRRSIADTLPYIDGGGGRWEGQVFIPASWAVVVIHHDFQGNIMYDGRFGGLAISDPNRPQYIGAERGAAGAAELTAGASPRFTSLAATLLHRCTSGLIPSL